MNKRDREEIKEYLCGPRDYLEGVSLYRRHGANLRLKKLFAVDDTETTRAILHEELRKLAGLTQQEFDRLPRRAFRAAKLATGSIKEDLIEEQTEKIEELEIRIEELEDELDETRSRYSETPEPIRKMIRFRDRFPFLSAPDCPDILKVLVADMFTAYDTYKAAHARLQTIEDDEAAAAMEDCGKVISAYIENREIWEELEYYKEHGSILGKAAKLQKEELEDYSRLSEIDLMKKLQSATVNESKQRKAVRTAEAAGERNERAEAALARWGESKRRLQKEVARRKKK